MDEDSLRDRDHEAAEPRPGEWLFDMLGQLYLRWRAGKDMTPPCELDVVECARLIGVFEEIEFAQHDDGVAVLHFPSEVLLVDPRREFPWRLLDVWEWAAEREFGLYDPWNQ